MIRVLVMITAAGFVLSVAALSGAIAIGGPDAIARGGWQLMDGRWNHRDWSHREWRDHSWQNEWDDDRGSYVGGSQTTRTLAWSGADSLDIDLAADVRYVQADGPATVTITGPQKAVARVIIRGDSILYERGSRQRRAPKLAIVVRAPDISKFDVSGRNTLSIENYRQDRIRLEVSGDSEVTATGETGEVDLELSGSSEADLTALNAKGAEAEVTGAAEAIIAPTEWARLEVSGAGQVRLLTNPKSLESDISGGGKVRQETPKPPSPPAKGAKT